MVLCVGWMFGSLNRCGRQHNRTFGTVWDITERKVTDQQIRALNLTLEERVQDRTQQLEEANKQLRSQPKQPQDAH